MGIWGPVAQARWRALIVIRAGQQVGHFVVGPGAFGHRCLSATRTVGNERQ